MGRVRVKVCGITSVEDGLMAADAGADALGFVFWPSSPRVVDVETARRIARATPAPPSAGAVTWEASLLAP